MGISVSWIDGAYERGGTNYSIHVLRYKITKEVSRRIIEPLLRKYCSVSIKRGGASEIVQIIITSDTYQPVILLVIAVLYQT